MIDFIKNNRKLTLTGLIGILNAVLPLIYKYFNIDTSVQLATIAALFVSSGIYSAANLADKKIEEKTNG